jgi:DNA-binding protein H-NS
MTSLAAIRKQIAALEAEAAQITKAEMSAAIAKIKELMQTFGLTAEHLGVTTARGKTSVTKKSKSKPKQSRAGKVKYADPKTGKTWSGFGRAPAWIAAAKSRDAFLVDKSGVVIAKAPAASKKVAKSASKVEKPAAKPPAKKAARATAAAAPATATKKSVAKKAGAKVKAKKSASKKVVSRGAATAVKPESTSSAGE